MREQLKKKAQNKQQSDQYKPGGFLGLTVELASIIIGAFIFAFIIRTYIAQPFFVKGESMEPNFLEKEYLIVDEISYRFKEPKREDVIIFKYPKDVKTYFIKRIAALPNETISIKNGSIVIYNKENPDGFNLEEDYLSGAAYTAGDTYAVLGENEYFMLGDNRPHSSDSRQWGVLDKKYIIGKAWMRIWPFDKLGIIEH